MMTILVHLSPSLSRNLGVGVCSLSARIGGIAAPLILLTVRDRPHPSLVAHIPHSSLSGQVGGACTHVGDGYHGTCSWVTEQFAARNSEHAITRNVGRARHTFKNDCHMKQLTTESYTMSYACGWSPNTPIIYNVICMWVEPCGWSPNTPVVKLMGGIVK